MHGGVRGGRAEEHVPGDDDMQDQESSGYDDELDGACESVPDDEVPVVMLRMYEVMVEKMEEKKLVPGRGLNTKYISRNSQE